MRPRPVIRRGLPVLAVALLAAPAAGCGGEATPSPPPTPAASVASQPATVDARVALAAQAALAADRRFTAAYTLDVPGWPQRHVVATTATDGSWRVDIPGGARGGTADVSIVQIEAGVFQCSLPAPTGGQPATCVKVADAGRRVSARYDPKIQRVFHNWLDVFTDRAAALAVSTAQPLDGVQGSCYAVDSISASLPAPVDVGIYCYTADGLLAGARVDFGELRLAAAPAAPPPSVDLPGPVVAGEPMGMSSPPPPPTQAPEVQPSSSGPA